MRTSPALIRRAAQELDSRFRGAKVRDVGQLPDGRFAIALWSRGRTVLLAFDIFGTPPLVTVEEDELPIAVEPGFVRAAGAALRGTAFLSARSRTGDRLLRLTFGTRSRFGVGDELDLYAELVPRFGNVIVVKRDTIVAAAKEFSLADNGTRAVAAGLSYELPPLVARDVPDDALAEDASVLEAFKAARDERMGAGERRRTAERRASLGRRLHEREKKLRDELAKIAARRRDADARERFRDEGQAIFATLHELEPQAQDEAKERAAKLFAKYKKLAASIAHLDTREASLRDALAAVESLEWETERADDADLDDVERAVAQITGRQANAANGPRRKRRAPLEFRTELGSRILIGRSPTENAELTFHIARPNDLWFHAQNIPGAHVILQRDARDEPPEADVLRAAGLAAFHSKARANPKVPIDYTERKFVRPQRNAPPGLVWYTNPRTLLVEPSAAPAEG